MSGYRHQNEPLFSKEDLRPWLEQQRRRAIEEVRSVSPDEILRRPHERIAEDTITRFEIQEPVLRLDQMTGEAGGQQVDVSGDFSRPP
jgi:hypothetical protein